MEVVEEEEALLRGQVVQMVPKAHAGSQAWHLPCSKCLLSCNTRQSGIGRK